MCGCSQMTTTTMELPSLVCLCVLISCGVSSADGNEPVKVVVMEGNNVTLPCSLSTKENIEFKWFDWKKDGQKEVFLYNAGHHYNNGHPGQDEKFKGRVFHSQDELQHGNASIIIRDTTVADSGNYTCVFPRLQPSQTFHIELIVKPVKVVVKEDSDAVLPCSLSTKENIESKLFDWKKDGQKEVFMYSAGYHYNNGHSDQQDRQFKGRAFHFQDELEHGNASIIIRDTTCSDSGNYTCIFPHLQPSQTFHIELIVGSASRPYVKTVQTTNGMKLQCEVLGVSPIPKVEWKDSSGNAVPADEPKINKGEKEGCHDVILEAPVTKTDNFSCIVTQEKINHQIKNDISVTHGATSEPLVTIIKRDNEVLLQCVVLGVSPKTKVEWKDSSGNIVPAEEPKITDRGGSYDINLQAPVTKTDNFRCVVTQKEIDHQIYAEIYAAHGPPIAWIVAVSVLGFVVLLFVVLKLRKRLRKKSPTENPPPDGEKHPMNSDNYKPED